jgi:hypothetical protein
MALQEQQATLVQLDQQVQHQQLQDQQAHKVRLVQQDQPVQQVLPQQ